MTDVNGVVVWTASYTPFGVATVNEDPDGDGVLVKNSFRLPGQYYDSETGLNYNYFRTYDPLVGRYTQSDPIGLRGGLNVFGYVLNDPVNSVDILGLWEYAVEYGTTGDGLSGNILAIENIVDNAFRDAAGRDAIVTFSTNGEHGTNSLHPSGCAIDLRIYDLNADQLNKVRRNLRKNLNNNFDVVFEINHIHIEYDPK